MSDDVTAQIEKDLRSLEQHSNESGRLRKKIVDKLVATVDQMTIDANADKASTLEAKMGVVNTLLKAISDTDDQRINLIKLKQRVKSDDAIEDTAKQVSTIVTSFLRQLNNRAPVVAPPGGSNTVQATDKLLDDVAAEAGVEVLDTELELSTGIAKETAE